MKAFENMSFEKKCEKLHEHIDDVRSREEMLEFAKYNIDEDRIFLALHILEAVNGKSAEYYNYDFGMGTLETPTPIEDDEDADCIIEEYENYLTELCESGNF